MEGRNYFTPPPPLLANVVGKFFFCSFLLNAVFRLKSANIWRTRPLQGNQFRFQRERASRCLIYLSVPRMIYFQLYPYSRITIYKEGRCFLTNFSFPFRFSFILFFLSRRDSLASLKKEKNFSSFYPFSGGEGELIVPKGERGIEKNGGEEGNSRANRIERVTNI